MSSFYRIDRILYDIMYQVSYIHDSVSYDTVLRNTSPITILLFSLSPFLYSMILMYIHFANTLKIA